MRHRTATLLWILTRHGHNLGNLFRLEGRRPTCSWTISQNLLDQFAQALVIQPFLFCQSQTSLCRRPALSPRARSNAFDVQRLSNPCIAAALGRFQYDTAATYQPLRAHLAARQPFQDLSLPICQLDLCR
jgi:hypothetical protein